MNAELLRPSCNGFLMALLLTGAVHAQEETTDPVAIPGKPNWKITPTASVDLTHTDNVTPGSGVKRDDLITRLAPGINFDGASARASGNLNYQWHQILYKDNQSLDSDQQTLRANGKLELIEQWLFIDATGNVSQLPVSAFGTQGVGNELVNGNRSETSSWQLSPYVRGKLASYADYEVRYSNVQTSAKTGTLSQYGDTVNQAWNGRLSGATPFAALAWSLTFDQQNIEVGTRRSMRTDRVLGTLDYRIDPQWKIMLNLGRESDDFNLAELQRRTNQGYGVEWSPTERTLLSLKQERRSYGTDHSLSFNHRTALSAWRYTDTRSVTLPAQQLTRAPVSSAYELLNLQLTSAHPDPAERAAVVQQTLQQLGISADAQIYGNILTAQSFAQRRKEASVSLTGANNTVTFSAQRSDSMRLGTGVAVVDDFSLSQNIRQSGFNTSWAHKLSPHTSMTLSGLSSRTAGDNANQNTQLRSISLLLNTKLGYRTSATAGLRQTQFDSKLGNSYNERALTGSLFMTF